MGKKKTLGLVRGTREAVIKFYENFEKFDVHFIAGSFRPFTYKSSKKNFKFINLPFYKPFGIDPAGVLKQRGNLSWIFIKGLEKNLQGCDVVSITDTYYFFNLQAVIWAKKNKVPVVTVIWTTIPHHITSWFPPYSYITRKVIKATDLFILRSKSALKFTDSLGIPRQKTKVIYKGVDLTRFSPAVTSHNSQVIKILFTGNLSRAKGLDDLLLVYQDLKDRYLNLRLIIAGDGELAKEVRRLSLDLRGRIDFRGFVPYHKLSSLYQEAFSLRTMSALHHKYLYDGDHKNSRRKSVAKQK